MVLRKFYDEHPLAKAIVEYAKKFREEEENSIWLEARDFASVPGHGVIAMVGNQELVVGNKSLMVDSGIHIPEEASEILMEAEEMAQTGVIVSMNHEVVGIIAIFDPLEPGAPDVISILKSMNVKSIMVTGDNWGTARAIAKEVGIETVVTEAKPDQKAEKVKELQMSGLTVAMVGDGFQMSRLTVAMVGDGINGFPTAIGAGTDIAIEALNTLISYRNL